MLRFSVLCQSHHHSCVGLLDHLQEVCDCLWSGGLTGYEFEVPVGAGNPAGVDVVPVLMWILQVDACFVVG